MLLLRSPEVGCDFSDTTLVFASPPANEPAQIALALLKLNVFVRLRRKLGWPIGALDNALRVFVRPSIAELTAATWRNAMRTALIYLAHLNEIATRTEDRVTREELITLWVPIPTKGQDNLYERLFLGGTIGQDPVFEDPLGGYLDDSSEPLAGHVDAIREALGVSHEEIEQILSSAGIVLTQL